MGAWEKAVASLGPVDGHNAQVSLDADPAAETDEYTGPCPSPARAWAPWVVVTSGVLAVGNAGEAARTMALAHEAREPREIGAVDGLRHIGPAHVVDDHDRGQAGEQLPALGQVGRDLQEDGRAIRAARLASLVTATAEGLIATPLPMSN